MPETTYPHPMVEKLENKRTEMGMSKEKFAIKVLDISYSTYHRWLTAEFNPPLRKYEELKQLVEEE